MTKFHRNFFHLVIVRINWSYIDGDLIQYSPIFMLMWMIFFSSKYYFANIIILRPNWWDGGAETKEGDKNLIILFIKRGKVRLNPLSLSLSFSIHTHTHTSTLTQNDGRSAWVMTKLWVSKRTAVKTSFFANQKIRRMRCMQFAHYFSFFQSYHKFLLTSSSLLYTYFPLLADTVTQYL